MDDLWADWPRPTHCSGCGRELRVVEEPDGFDGNGEPQVRTWLQCPRFPRNGFMSLFRGQHTCVDRDMPLVGKFYR